MPIYYLNSCILFPLWHKTGCRSSMIFQWVPTTPRARTATPAGVEAYITEILQNRSIIHLSGGSPLSRAWWRRSSRRTSVLRWLTDQRGRWSPIKCFQPVLYCDAKKTVVRNKSQTQFCPTWRGRTEHKNFTWNNRKPTWTYLAYKEVLERAVFVVYFIYFSFSIFTPLVKFQNLKLLFPEVTLCQLLGKCSSISSSNFHEYLKGMCPYMGVVGSLILWIFQKFGPNGPDGG